MEDWVESEEEDEEDEEEKQCWFCGRVTTELEEIAHDVGFEPIIKGLPAMREIDVPCGSGISTPLLVCAFCQQLLHILAVESIEVELDIGKFAVRRVGSDKE